MDDRVDMSVDSLRCQVCGGTEHRSYTTDPQGDFVRCRGCGLIVRNPPAEDAAPSDDDQAQEDYYEMYQERRPHKVWDDSRRLEAIVHYVDADGPVDHLEIGCGLGSMVEAGARRLGLRSVGIDVLAYSAEFCRSQGLDARVGSLVDTGFEDESFDLVTAMNVLEHIPRTEDGLREIHRVLRPGGVVGMIVPSGAYLKAHLLRHRYRNYHGKRAGFHQTYHSPATLLRLIERNGFEPLCYPWLISTRLQNPRTAVGELVCALPRLLARQVMRLARMQREIFAIARRN